MIDTPLVVSLPRVGPSRRLGPTRPLKEVEGTWIGTMPVPLRAIDIMVMPRLAVRAT